MYITFVFIFLLFYVYLIVMAEREIIHQFQYDSFPELMQDVRDGADPFTIRQGLTEREHAEGGRRWLADFEVYMNIEGLVPMIGGVVVTGINDILRYVRDMQTEESDTIVQFLNGTYVPDQTNLVQDGDRSFMTFDLYRVTGSVAEVGHSFRATSSSRFWGPLGRVNNCVVKQIAERVEGYLSCGTKRGFMWDDNGVKFSTDRLNPMYSSAVAKRLSTDKYYIKIKTGVAQFLASRDCTVSDSFGFDVRDLCTLASLCEVRIVVWMNTRMFPVLRWDTDTEIKFEGEKDRRYHFHFWMTNCQHLEICTQEDVNRNESNELLFRPFSPSVAAIKYVGDDYFGHLFKNGFAPDEADTSKVYTILRSCLRWPLPDIAKNTKYGDVLLREGNTVIKHECYKEWLVSRDMDPVDIKHRDIMCVADIHTKSIMAGLAYKNVKPIKQVNTPSLFEAVSQADKVTTHTLNRPMDEGSTIYEVDGRKWYATEFSKVPNFPYFHGIPASDTWSEYMGTRVTATCDMATGMWIPDHTYIGNGEGDRAFTFEYGKYAIFLIETLNFDKCDVATVGHLTRDRLFVDFISGRDTLCLASPVLHFLQDIGVVWQASYVWICYGVVDDWIFAKTADETAELRRQVVSSKSYAIAVGRMMAGRNPLITSTHITPDVETAKDLLHWHSTKFAGGGLSQERTGLMYRRHSPDSVLQSEDAEVYGATTVSASTLVRGGSYTRRAFGTKQECGPYEVNTHTDMFGFGSTMAHISGAIHAMCFVQLYRAALCIPPDIVAGFSLDSIKCVSDPTEFLGSYISESDSIAGSFKPVVAKVLEKVYSTTTPLLSPLYVNNCSFQGLATPDRLRPLWGPYQDGLKQFNIVTGPAGSGKTWRHLMKHGSDDQRVDKVLYAPLTNYLAAQVKSKGYPATTSFKAFNRRVDDDRSFIVPRNRYNDPARWNRVNNHKLDGVACVLRDEVTMDNAAMVSDAISCCNEYHRQLLIVGDFDKDRFFQLSAVSGGGPAMMTMALEASGRDILPKQINWVAPQQVFRQVGDPELAELIETLRNHTGPTTVRWATFFRSDMFEHIDYDTFLGLLVPSKDIVISPWHKLISELTDDVLDTMQMEDELLLRGNFPMPYKVDDDEDPAPIQRLAMFDGDPLAYKGVTTKVSKRELFDLEGTKFMDKGFPYAGAGGVKEANLVNPMIGTTVYALQGLSLDPEATLYVLNATPGGYEWFNETQPCQAYVIASRVRTRGQIKFVDKSRNLRRRT